MVGAFGSGKGVKTGDRWLTKFPRLDRGTLARSGALQPGMRTTWVLKAGPGAADAISIQLTALPDGLEFRIGDQVQVAHYWYDSPWPHKSLRQFFRCPACERVCRTLYFDQHWGCRVCLELTYPVRSEPAGRALAIHQIAELQRSLIKARPGSRRWKDLLAQIAALHAILTADVARVRRDLRRRLKNDYRR
jgi:hypothetical protein